MNNRLPIIINPRFGALQKVIVLRKRNSIRNIFPVWLLTSQVTYFSVDEEEVNDDEKIRLNFIF